MIMSPILNSCWSSAIIDLNLVLAFGPNTIWAFVFFDKVICPLTKSA